MRERIIYGNDGLGPIARYVDGELVEWREEMPSDKHDGIRQHIMKDIEPYQSMVDGTWITSRSKHREHLKAHGVQEVGNDSSVLNPKYKGLQPPPGLKNHVVRAYQQVMERRRK